MLGVTGMNDGLKYLIKTNMSHNLVEELVNYISKEYGQYETVANVVQNIGTDNKIKEMVEKYIEMLL